LINGNLKGKTITVSQAVASGIFTRDEVFLYKVSNTFPIFYSNRDDYFNYVTILLSGDANTFVRDASNNNFTLTTTGDVRPSAFSPYNTNWSNYFDGTGDYLSVPYSSSLDLTDSTNWTVECWIYRNVGGAEQYLFSSRIAGSSGWEWRINSTNLMQMFLTGGSSITSSATIPIAAWTHLAVTRASGTVRFFINGTLDSSASFSTGTTATSTALYIGYGTAGGGYMNGYISNARLIKGTAYYTSAFTPPTEALTAISNTVLLTCQSNRFIDNSTNAFTITKNGDVAISAFGPFTETDVTTGSTYFDGSGDRVDTPASGQFNPSGDFTIGFWFFPNSALSINQNIIGNLTGNLSTDWLVQMVSGTLSIYTNGTTVRISSASAVIPFQWNYISVTRNTGVISAHVNGASIGTYSQAGSFGSASKKIEISNATNNINGFLSDVIFIDGTAVTTVPSSQRTANSQTQFLTFQNRVGHNNHQFVDESGHRNIVTRSGNVSQGSFSPFSPTGWSNFFDGNDALTTPSNTAFTYGTSDFTVEGWVYLTGGVGAGGYSYVFGQGASSGSSATLGLYIQDGVFKVWNGSAVISGSVSYTLNTWTHFAISRSGTSLRLFINGVLSGSATNSSNITTGSTTGISIGRWSEISDTNYITGYFSNFRVLKGTAYYTTAFTPPTEPLTAISGTSLLTCQSNRFIDNSTNNFTITKNGDVKVINFSPFAPTAVYSPITHGGSAYFDGTGDYISIPSGVTTYTSGGSTATNKDFTIEGFFYLNVLADSILFARWPSYNTRGLSFSVGSTGTINFLCANVAASWLVNIVSSAGVVKTGEWNHFAATRAGNTYRLFLNGALIGSSSPTAFVISDETTNITIGGSLVSGYTLSFNGYISNVRFNTTQALYTTAFTPPTSILPNSSNTVLSLPFKNAAIVDVSSRNNIETVNDAKIITSTKKFGTGSLSFDGTGDYLYVPSSPNLTLSYNFTIEGWAYLNASGNYRFFTVGDTIGSSGIEIYVSSGNWVVYSNGATRITGSSATREVWTHLAVVRSGSTVTLYVNGTASGSTWTSSATFSGACYVGAEYYNSSVTADTNGYIDDFRITNGYARYTTTFAVPTVAFPTASATS
jgi:hypothetical protein